MPIFRPPNIGKLKTQRDLKGLIEALGYQKDARVRKAAAAVLGESGDPIAVEPLIVALRDRAVSVRMTAAKALEQIQDTNALEPLENYMEHVRQAKQIALKAKIERYKAKGNARGLICLLEDKDLGDNLEDVTLALMSLGMKALIPLFLALGDRRRIESLVQLNRDGQLHDFVIQIGIGSPIADYLQRIRK